MEVGMAWVSVKNDGPLVVETNYWDLEHAARGLLFFSWNAGALRVLVPPAAERMLEELPPPGTECRYVQAGDRAGLLYLDDPERPYFLDVDIRQCDRRLPPGDHGRRVLLLWYGKGEGRGTRLLRREEAVVEVIKAGWPPDAERTAPPDPEQLILLSPSCVVEALSMGPDGAPVRVSVSPEALLAPVRDPGSEWVPNPSGPYSRVARAARPPGTGAWHCLLAASEAGGAPVLVRLLWAGDSLAQALRGLEEAAWRRLPREFVVAALTAHRIGRVCRGIEGPVAGAVVPWTSRTPPDRPPPAMSRRDVERLALECLDRLARHDAVDVPERGTDAYRFLVELGSLVWQEQHARRLAGAYVGATETPAVMVHAVGLHAMLRHPVEVEASGVRVRGADVRASEELWAQWCEWLLCGVPEGFLRWVHPDGLYRVSDMLEPDRDRVPDLEACRGVERALVEDAEASARYVPVGAFVLELPEGLFLREWGIRSLWLWVEGRRMWCAVAGEDGVPCESFLWEAGRGVVTNLVVPLDVSPALGAVLAAVWRDMVVAGEEAAPRRAAAGSRRAGAVREPRGPAAGVVDAAAVFPRRRTVRLELSGDRDWGAEEDRRAARRAHGVRGYLRRLAPGRKATGSARAAAGEYGIVLPDGHTFVRPHVRGRGEGAAPGQPVRVVARGLATVAAVLGGR
jgi:hypothetical protein